MGQRVILLGLLGVFAYQDWKKKKVSVYLLLVSGIVGLLCHLYSREIGMGDMMLGAAIGLALLFCGLVTGEKIGYGDGAMLMVSGIFLGFSANLELLLISLLLLEMAALFLVVVKRKGRRYRIPFIPFLLAGYLYLLI